MGSDRTPVRVVDLEHVTYKFVESKGGRYYWTAVKIEGQPKAFHETQNCDIEWYWKSGEVKP